MERRGLPKPLRRRGCTTWVWLGVCCCWLVHALWREGMYRLGVGWESIVGGLYTLFGRWDVQIECGFVSLLVV